MGCKEINSEQKEERMRPKKRKLHELPFTDVEKSRIIRLAFDTVFICTACLLHSMCIVLDKLKHMYTEFTKIKCKDFTNIHLFSKLILVEETNVSSKKNLFSLIV